ncbi:MAG: putative acetyltransferase [Planctomycetota bacterium]|jgi:putative acetyltransferase
MALSDLLRTDAFITQLLGSMEQHDGYAILRTPDNPGFYFGNFLILEETPKDLESWLRVFEECYGPEIRHRCFSWGGQALDEETAKAAARLGLESDGVVELCMHGSPTKEQSGTPSAVEAWTIRRLHPEDDWDASAALSVACDSSSAEASEIQRLFTQRIRAARREMLVKGLATWWGVFEGKTLIGQCGHVACGEIGRYQNVETHPDWRRRGICSALITAVARDAFERLKVDRLILAAELDGPAIGLYTRLGFKETGRTHSLIRHPDPMHVRDECVGDHAGVRSLVNAAFGTPEEAPLIEELRQSPGVISLIAEQSNTILGHILFSPMWVEGEGSARSAVALAPLAVRPTAQGQGHGTKLVQAGLERCKRAGFDLCVVIGSPAYYRRFGFEPATPHGLRNPFGVEDEHFMVHALTPGALQACAGNLIYDQAFDALQS